jgi:hypothetical protein
MAKRRALSLAAALSAAAAVGLIAVIATWSLHADSVREVARATATAHLSAQTAGTGRCRPCVGEQPAGGGAQSRAAAPACVGSARVLAGALLVHVLCLAVSFSLGAGAGTRRSRGCSCTARCDGARQCATLLLEPTPNVPSAPQLLPLESVCQE